MLGFDSIAIIYVFRNYVSTSACWCVRVCFATKYKYEVPHSPIAVIRVVYVYFSLALCVSGLAAECGLQLNVSLPQFARFVHNMDTYISGAFVINKSVTRVAGAIYRSVSQKRPGFTNANRTQTRTPFTICPKSARATRTHDLI